MQRNPFILPIISLVVFILAGITLPGRAQDSARQSLWTEEDRQYLVANLVRTRDSLVKETTNLTPAQWTFKEFPDRWSIAQVMEHLSYWEIIFAREVELSLRQKPHPEWGKTARTDSAVLAFLYEETPHTAHDYVWPLGLNEGKNNLALLTKLRDSAIAFIRATKQNLRVYYLNENRPNAYQIYLNLFGHCDRHLKQIKRVKADPRYPGKK